MKTLKKINLRGLSEVLSEKELKNVMGGGSGSNFCLTDSMCGNGEYCDWWYFHCAPKATDTPKIDACAGVSEYGRCVWDDAAGTTHNGRCLQFAFGPLHCSDNI